MILDVLLGSLVLGLAGWALVQTGSAKPPGGGGCARACGPSACNSEGAPEEGEQLVKLGAGEEDRRREG
jgi:hypothetical protein